MQEKNQRVSNSARTKATKAALLKAARALFVEKGYAETATPEVVKTAGVTRGALYHHFQDKADLFRAVVRSELEKVAHEIDSSAIGEPKSAIEALLAGSAGFLNAMKDEGRVRIILLDGPAVLGREEMDQIDQETSTGSLRMGLSAAMKAGEIQEHPVDVLTDLLSAVFDRAALGVSRGDQVEEHLGVIAAILEGLR